jgi:hypothetical protein
MNPQDVHWLAVFVSALSTFLIGGLWYSPILFAGPWMALNGFSQEELRKANMGKIFGGSFLLALVIATNLAFFLGKEATITFGAAAGLAAGLGWVATSMGIVYLFERKPMKLLLINGGYHVVAYVVMGTILGAWH